MSLFTVIPVGDAPRVRRQDAARAVLALPLVGLLLALPSAGVLLAVEAGGPSTTRRLLAATLAVGLLGLLTGGLHLDGLADTADGLGSGRRGEEALAIMRRSDIGPMGVVTLLFVVLAQVTALASLPPGPRTAASLVAAVVTGRVAVVLATGPSSPAARPDGFGALVAAATTTRARIASATVFLAAVTAGAAAFGGPSLTARALAGVLAGLCAAGLLRRAARRRLGGMTGDVFGALIEACTATVLLVLALAA
jgi:adenosylcobinamide-GDP ribazoletransferase